MDILSVNGPDNVGKSTHCRLLTRSFPNAIMNLGGLDVRRIAGLELSDEQFSQWWFETTTTDALSRILLHAYSARLHLYTPSNRIVLLDRGVKMIEAASTATAMVKEGLDLERARERISTAGDWGKFKESFSVLFWPGADKTTAVNQALEREDRPFSGRYRRYQEALWDVLHYQMSTGCYDAVIDTSLGTVLDIQNRFRQVLEGRGHSFPKLWSHVPRVVGLGGLSESGKSTAAAHLRSQHSCERLKISYLLHLASVRWSISDIYQQDDNALAEYILDELDRYSHFHYFHAVYSIESLHRYQLTLQLKQLAGDRFTIVYCDSNLQARAGRSTIEDVLRRDEIKRARGAEQIKTISDVVITNNTDLASFLAQVNRKLLPTFAPAPSIAQQELAQNADVDFRIIALRALTENLGARLRMAVVTGSTGRGSHMPGWSDFDLLIVTQPASFERVSKAREEIIRHGITVGVSLITISELQSLCIDGKTAHHLRMLAEDKLSPLYVADGLMLPVVSRSVDVRVSTYDLPLALHAIRRILLADSLESKVLYKKIILVMKIILRIEGENLDGYEEVVRRFGQIFPSAPHIPERIEWMEQSREDSYPRAVGVAFLSWFELYVEGTLGK